MCQTHLILLVGGNPLPCLVSARYQAPGKAAIWLLYSPTTGNQPGTENVMKQLEDQLCSFSESSDLEWDVRPFPISSSVDWKIKEDITELLRQIGDQDNIKVIFDYTGGTKPMAVHVYRQILFHFHSADFTYLDPRELALRKDGSGITGAGSFTPLLKERPSGKIKPDARLKLTLKELAELHGYVQVDGRSHWAKSSTPGLFEVTQSILPVYKDASQREKWIGSEIWHTKSPLDKEISLEQAFKDFPEVSRSLNKFCDLNKSPQTLRGVVDILKPDHENGFTSCSGWFTGIWLEEYTWECLRQALTKCPEILYSGKNLLHKYTKEIYNPQNRKKSERKLQRSNDPDFELDMAFMIGYQLFALSCITSHKKSHGLEHFFEVYVRACQLGGEEARFALVCFSNDTKSLEKELSHQWDAKGKLKVFGMQDLTDLTQRIIEWYTILANKA